MEQLERADRFRRLHGGGRILVLPNAWDVASAVAFAALPGCRALATSSAAVARSLGFDDGEQTPVEKMLQAVERIAGAVDVPVSADLEAGYGDPEATAAGAWVAGAVGMNFEDSRGGELVPPDEQAELVRLVCAAAPGLVVNARVDVFISGDGNVDEAVERANAYLAAGAGCVYPIACPFAAVEELARRIRGPVNVLLEDGGPSVPELERLGVARATWGSGLASAALAEATRIAAAGLAP